MHNADVTLHLTTVEDARAYGCVPTNSDGRVTAFLEKMDNPITNTINAGCYVFSSQTIKAIPLHTIISVERETFPNLIANHRKVFGFIDNSYWLDIGTPMALLKGSVDVVTGVADGSALLMADVAFHSSQALIMGSANVDASAIIDKGSCIGALASVEAGAHISGSIIDNGAQVQSGARSEERRVGKECCR